ncbi:hypothetical protein [Brevundimonas sp.]|uniref:PspA/IM30 family protein n=1 Tax=Brevundimonas sp. TaxID=1871086 RepID=UPI0026381506|nr:hypothetical protein [Brevundimonas sp.]
MTQVQRWKTDGNQRRVERISQSTIEIVAADIPTAFEEIRTSLIDWLSRKAGAKLPDAILDGKTGDFNTIGFQRVETAALTDPLYWAARQDDQDRDFPRRSWITEAALSTNERGVVLGHRLHCVTLGEAAPFSRSIPRFMRDVGRRFETRLDGREIELTAKRVTTPEDIEWLFALLTSSSRRHPVIGIAQSYRPIDTENDGYLVDADALAAAVFGTAHVCMIGRDASEELTSILGELSVRNGGVRSWRHPLSLEDTRFSHPLSTAKMIDDWGQGAGAKRFEREVIDWSLRYSAGRRDADNAIPPFSEVRHIAAQRERQAAKADGRTDQELLELALDENERLAKEMQTAREEHSQMLDLAEEDVQRIHSERDDALSEQNRLLARLKHVESALASQRAASPEKFPDDLADLKQWAADNLGDSVVLLPRALNAAKKSPFEDVEYVFQVLLAIRDGYAPMRRSGDSDLKNSWDDKMRELGLTLTPSFAGAGAGEFGDEYRTMWAGRNREFDMHFKGCSSRDPRYGFRCYFFWDDEKECVVIGAIPGHLTTRAS